MVFLYVEYTPGYVNYIKYLRVCLHGKKCARKTAQISKVCPNLCPPFQMGTECAQTL